MTERKEGTAKRVYGPAWERVKPGEKYVSGKDLEKGLPQDVVSLLGELNAEFDEAPPFRPYQEPYMPFADYTARNLVINRISADFALDKKAATFENLQKILDSEKVDILAKERLDKEKELSPDERKRFHEEINFIDRAREGAKKMMNGEKLEDDDPSAAIVDQYLAEKLDEFEVEKEETSSPTMEDYINDAIALFEAFCEESLNYNSPKKPQD